MNAKDAFAVLALSPTLDAGAIKRAYFSALAKTPPHVDPEGFRRLRQAYEQLSDPAQRTLAFLRAPADSSAELARWEARWGERVTSASQAVKQRQQASHAVALFVERLSRLRPADVLRLDRSPASGGQG